MFRTLTTCILATCLGLSGCATSMLSTALPNETTKVQTTILKTDQIIALGQAAKNQQGQGLVFIGQDYNYLMTDGSAEFLKIIKTIPTTERTLNIPSPLVLTMDDPNHFHGVIQVRYNTRMGNLNEKQKDMLKDLGFKQNFAMLQAQENTPYPYINILFKGQLYETKDLKDIQQKLVTPYVVELQEKIETTKKHPFKRATRKVLYPLAMTFDVIVFAPSLIWADLHGDFNK
ncbi:hypothetical protein [Acinetobacter calcoaceticus]|uniref:hypothetical protein n=1 Tax=Acinetobacter calcoaceticus TaxID=471 RepID=UPI001E5C64E3|nr:hypothetical protein [Acinetobacter calcoaceticus]UGQ30150.1 hypothetical protein LRO84_01435 [Acinetobacter calcoaceticus]